MRSTSTVVALSPNAASISSRFCDGIHISTIANTKVRYYIPGLWFLGTRNLKQKASPSATKLRGSQSHSHVVKNANKLKAAKKKYVPPWSRLASIIGETRPMMLSGPQVSMNVKKNERAGTHKLLIHVADVVIEMPVDRSASGNISLGSTHPMGAHEYEKLTS